MAVFRCKMCGGTLEFEPGAAIGVCEYCGTKQTLPRLDDDRRANLYDRANHYRRNNEYDKAAQIYETILNEDNTDAEAYWSLVLCRYGVEYVEDPATHKRVPTVNRTQFTSIFDDDNYRSAIRLADGERRAIYEAEAAAINGIQKGILAISEKEKPFDVFICYKETDGNGERTPDSVLAYDLYQQLTQEGFKVFFARVTLEDKLGAAYEPYIFAALNSAKVMVVLGTKPEYFNAVWVKNEWSRYLSLVKQSGGKKALIPAYKDMDPYDLPEEFSHLQGQDMSKLGFMQDLVRGIEKIARAGKLKTEAQGTAAINSGAANVASLLDRAFELLEEGEWEIADKYCKQVLDQDLENAEAYLGKLMAGLRVRRKEGLAACAQPFDRNVNYQRIVRFGDEALKAELNGYLDRIKKRIEASKKRTGRIIIVVASFLVLIGIAFCVLWFATPVATFSYEANDDGGYTVVKRNKSFVNDVSIPSEHFGKKVTRIGEGAFSDCTELTSVEIPDSVVSIGEKAFKGCTGLTSIEIPDSVVTIDAEAFNGCTGLTSIEIPDSVTSIEKSAFYGCTGATSITIGKGVTSIGYYAFAHCSGLSSVTIGNGVTSIGGFAFLSCTGMTEITVPDSVESIGEWAFAQCTRLSAVTIGNAVTSVGDKVFDKCPITSATVPITVIPSVPKNELRTIVIIGNEVTGVWDRSFSFSTYPELTSVTIGNGVTSIREYAFTLCAKLTSVTIGNDVTSIENGAFNQCYSLASVTIGNGVTSIGTFAFNSCHALSSVNIPEGVTTIGNCAFNGCSSLTSFTIPQSVTSIGDAAFGNCSALTWFAYQGTKAQWDEVKQGANWRKGTGATVIYCTDGYIFVDPY